MPLDNYCVRGNTVHVPEERTDCPAEKGRLLLVQKRVSDSLGFARAADGKEHEKGLLESILGEPFIHKDHVGATSQVSLLHFGR
jgi:hypothetical protein